MMLKLAFRFTALLGILLTTHVATAQTYCPQSLMGQYGQNTYYYDCQVCDMGKDDNCTAQYVAFPKPQDCSQGFCKSCGGTTCDGVGTSVKANGSTDPSAVILSDTNDYSFADSDVFYTPSGEFVKRSFSISVGPAGSEKYFQCYHVMKGNASRNWICVGRQVKNMPPSIDPNNKNLTTTRQDSTQHHHSAPVLVPAEGNKPAIKNVYCYLISSDGI